MNRIMLMTKVADVPNRAHQRMYSSLPLGKNRMTIAKTVGRKMQSDIQIRSVSVIMSSYSNVESDLSFRARRFLRTRNDQSRHHERQNHPDAHGGEHQEQHITAQV